MGVPHREEIEVLFARSTEALEATKVLSEKQFYSEAMSRAYYAMFYAATACLRVLDLRTSKHSGVVALFGQHLAKTGEIDQKFHKMLETAFKERNLADYEAFAKFSAEQVAKQLSEAEAFLGVAKAFVKRKGLLAS